MKEGKLHPTERINMLFCSIQRYTTKASYVCQKEENNSAECNKFICDQVTLHLP